MLIWPLRGWVSQRWGERPALYQATLGIPYHNGLDIAAALGTPVWAIAAGEVMFVGSDPPGYGYYVRIFHSAYGFHSFYAHLDSYSVGIGQQVVAGQEIGRCGSTGWSTGPHLHLEIRLGTRMTYAQGTFGHTRGRVDPQTVFEVLSTK